MIDQPYDATDWNRLSAFSGRPAGPEDVDKGAAVFALGDTTRPRVLDMTLPQPAIWWSDEGELAAVVVQAEAHVTEDDETLEVLGVTLPDGSTAICFLEDVDLVDPTDPVWLKLIDEALEAELDALDDEDDEVFDEDDLLDDEDEDDRT